MLRKKIGLLSTLVIMALSIAGFSAPAQATPRVPLALWTIGVNSPNVLFSVNPSTGAATAVGPGTGISQGMGAAVDLTTGLLYVLDYGCTLFTLNVSTGIATTTGHNLTTVIAGGRTYCDAMTIGRDGVGYLSVHNANGEPYFLSFVPSTGVTTRVGPMMSAYYDWLAFDPSNGILYGQNDDSADLYSMNPVSGLEARVGPFSASGPSNPYSHGVVIVGDGTFFAQERNGLAAGTTDSWSGSTIGSYGNPLNSLGNGSLLLFTTTNPYLVDPVGPPASDSASDPVVVPALATTGMEPRGLLALAGGALALLASGAVALVTRRSEASV